MSCAICCKVRLLGAISVSRRGPMRLITGPSRAHHDLHGVIIHFTGSSMLSRGRHGWRSGRAWYKAGHDYLGQ